MFLDILKNIISRNTMLSVFVFYAIEVAWKCMGWRLPNLFLFDVLEIRTQRNKRSLFRDIKTMSNRTYRHILRLDTNRSCMRINELTTARLIWADGSKTIKLRNKWSRNRCVKKASIKIRRHRDRLDLHWNCMIIYGLANKTFCFDDGLQARL